MTEQDWDAPWGEYPQLTDEEKDAIADYIRSTANFKINAQPETD